MNSKITLNLEHKILELPEDVIFLDESFESAGIEYLSEDESEKVIHFWYNTRNETVAYGEADKIAYALRKRGLLDKTLRTGYNILREGSEAVYLEGDLEIEFGGEE